MLAGSVPKLPKPQRLGRQSVNFADFLACHDIIEEKRTEGTNLEKAILRKSDDFIDLWTSELKTLETSNLLSAYDEVHVED